MGICGEIGATFAEKDRQPDRTEDPAYTAEVEVAKRLEIVTVFADTAAATAATASL